MMYRIHARMKNDHMMNEEGMAPAEAEHDEMLGEEIERLEEEIAREIAAEQARKRAAMDMLASTIEKKFSSYAGARTTKEREWADALAQLEGDPSYHDVSGAQRAMGASSSSSSRRPRVNITRQKTNIATRRMEDIQFPMSGDKNFTIKPTPIPELEEIEGSDEMLAPPEGMEGVLGGNMEGMEGLTVGEAQANERSKADYAAAKMERRIFDALVESGYGQKAREAIKDMTELGTGILKGPVVQPKVRKRYTTTEAADGSPVNILEVEHDLIPTVQRVDPRMFYPDPNARSPSEMEDCIELHLMRAKDLITLSEAPGYHADMIREVLETDPSVGDVASALAQLSIASVGGGTIQNRYAVKEYHGPLDKECLFQMGIITEGERDDPMMRPYGEAWVVNGRCIRVSLSILDGDYELPYGIGVWETDPNSLFGHGVPWLTRSAQRVADSAWKMLLDNAGLTAGPQIVLNREMIKPANAAEGWGIAPMKVWYLTEYGVDVREAMQFVNIPAQQEPLANIIQMAMQFADMESAVPLMQQGEMPSGNNTLGGMAMVMSASNIVQRGASRRWDDNVTLPIIGRFYHYFKQYEPDPDMAFDMEVNVDGATDRIDAQQRSQDLERLLGLGIASEDILMNIDKRKAVRELIITSRLGDILRPEDEVEQELQQRQDQQAADPAMIQSEVAMGELQLKQAELENKTQLKLIEMQIAREKAQIELQIETMKLKAAMAAAASREDIAYSKLAEDINMKQLQEQNKLLLKEMDFAKFQAELEVKNKFGTGI